jgi:integrase
MPIAHNRNRYQEGSLDRVHRAKGPDVWVYRYRETTPEGKRVQRKRVIGSVEQYKTLTAAKIASDNLRLAINAPTDSTVRRITVAEAWGHFQTYELSDPDVGRSATTIDSYREYFKAQILPQWRDVYLDDVKSVAVEKWLRSLSHLAPGTRAKIRNHMSALFSHAIRHELFFPREGINPLSRVRQGAGRVREPDVLTLSEIRSILDRIEPQAIKMMVVVAAASGLRRSEIRGLKWMDCDLAGRWFRLRRGLVRKHETNLKTEASRRGIPILPELAEALLEWRHATPYNRDDDWVFASPFTNGKRPYWAESALKAHIRPAAESARINKTIGWHTFRHSLASLLGSMKEDTKTVQELMRHASSKITMDVYQHGDEEAKRSALTHASAIFALPSEAG